ncbi:hypothetical protein HDU84_007174 [Entophlyctis sp. JEL0112]|nr:hypothetical protein HDU84_007174 [Entophlyctis sp. JEL0112]
MYDTKFKQDNDESDEDAMEAVVPDSEELDKLRETNNIIALNWTVQEIETEARKIVNYVILPISNSNAKACVCPFFAVSYRQQEESTAFLMQRRGSYQSTTRGVLVSQKASRPILTKSEGAMINATQLWGSGFQRIMVFEQRNWVNMAALEKKIQRILAIEMKLPIGRHLFRNYFGGERTAKGGDHLRYGVYVTFCKTGYWDYVLNA